MSTRDVHPVKVTHQCDVHEKSTYPLSVFQKSMERFSYEEVQQEVRDLFKLPPSIPVVLTCWDGDSETTKGIRIAKDGDLATARVALLFLLRQGPLLFKVVGNCSSATVKVVHGDTYFRLSPSPGQLQFCYDEFHSRVRGLFNLPPSVQFVFSYKDPEFPRFRTVVTNDEDLKAVLKQKSPSYPRLDITIADGDQNYSPYVVKVSHNLLLRRLAFAADELEISYDQFRSQVLDLFKLPDSLQLELSYVDEDGDVIIMSKGEELKSALILQSLNPLRLDLKIPKHDSDMKSLLL